MSSYPASTCAQAVIQWALTSTGEISSSISAIMAKLYSLLFFTSAITVVFSTTISDIKGNAWLSPFANKAVQNVTGLVTAKGTTGFWIAGEKSKDVRVSNGLMVYSSAKVVLGAVNVGDYISLSGNITEYRSSAYPDYFHLTELEYPTNIVVLSSNNTVNPVVLGKDRSPPTQKFSALDKGHDGFLSVPNNSSRINTVNAALQPDNYGLDFWQSLEGQLVTIPKPTAVAFTTSYGEFWAVGNWKKTGVNSRGGITLNFGQDGVPDGNPEAIFIGSPLDKTKNPQTAVGVGLTDITGVVTYQYGYYYVLPLTAPQIISTPSANIPATTLTSSTRDLCTVTFGDYNVQNMPPTGAHLPAVAAHIVNYLKTPDIMFIQEVQDNSGAKDDGVVDANVTLTNLVNSIASLSNVTYKFASINPIDGQDGGVPGGNIRVAYLYRPEKLELVGGSPAGGSLDKTVVQGTLFNPKLNFNPGRIDPTNTAWNSSRKPLVAHWAVGPLKSSLFTVNVHLASKGGSTTTNGDARPPVNSPIQARTNQISTIATFIKSLLQKNPLANIVIAGDFNEFIQTRSVYKPFTPILSDIDDAAGIPELERYSYVYDQNSEQLDHAFISLALRLKKVEFEHIHANTWAPNSKSQVSDHDPSVGRIRVC